MKHLLYRTTNLINNRFYVGMHSTKNVDDGYLGSGRRIKAEIRKYGRENFKREILEVLPSVDALKKREAEVVTEELLADPLCLNLKNGGEGGGRIWNEEHAIKFHRAGWEAMNENKDHVATSLKAQATIKARGAKVGFATRDVSGKNNPRFGVRRAYVTKYGVNRMVLLDQLEAFLNDGWQRGRVS